jgi:hypothetical protein
VLNEKGVAEGLEHLPMVREFADIFPEELHGMLAGKGIGVYHRPETED